MSSIKSFWSFIKSNPGKVAVVALISVVFLGGVIVKFYNQVNTATGNKLPAPKVSA